MAGKYPLEELAIDEVERRYNSGQFPITDHLLCRSMKEQCWNQQLNTAAAVCEFLQSLQEIVTSVVSTFCVDSRG